MSECDVTNVASRSTINGRAPSVAASGAFESARAQARAPAAARAELIAFNAAGAFFARASIVRDTIGSDATARKSSPS